MNDIDDEKRKIDLASILAEFSSLSAVQMMARLDETIEDIESLFQPHGVCADCRFNQLSERPSIWANCINDCMGELADTSEHSLYYPYSEGAMLETTPNFGCVNFEEKP